MNIPILQMRWRHSSEFVKGYRGRKWQRQGAHPGTLFIEFIFYPRTLDLSSKSLVALDFIMNKHILE